MCRDLRKSKFLHICNTVWVFTPKGSYTGCNKDCCKHIGIYILGIAETLFNSRHIHTSTEILVPL